MKQFDNKRADEGKQKINSRSLENQECNCVERLKLNFSYLDESQKYAFAINRLSQGQLQSLFNCLRDDGARSIQELKELPRGSGSNGRRTAFATYGKEGEFPSKAKKYFKSPIALPERIQWARHRIGNKFRLIGFMIPEDLHHKRHKNTGCHFDKNTLYVVFLDLEHKFWPTR